MKIIVDAYNLLHAIFPGPRANDKQRQKLIDDLRDYAKRSGNKILLVFDGGDFTYPYVDKQKNITIAWAGQRMSADDWIMEYLDKNPNEDLLIASSDREIQAHASDLGVVCMGAFSFYKTIERKMRERPQPLRHRGPVRKTTDRTDEIVDQLMQEEQDEIEWKAEDETEGEIIASGNKLSKRERLLMRQLKKL